MKRLLLLRHGEAEPAGAAASDFERALTAHGRAQALQAARRLRRTRCVPDAILASPALRTRETATIVAARLECLQALRYEPLAYPGSPELLLQLLSTLPDESEAALLVGHNPGLSALARRLAALASAGRSGAEPPELSTGGLCRIELASGTWSAIESGVTDVTLLS
ncbi:MAG TPA: histidine phosphatase family protein [Steroidobacteraceae bacterium]|jgi:phosphohistidine phosphatase|nr:histidine phosphatase family protein [Steroidobacteraceae bacterium]